MAPLRFNTAVLILVIYARIEIWTWRTPSMESCCAFLNRPRSTCLVLCFHLSFFFVIPFLLFSFFALAFINLIVISVLICILHNSLFPIPFVFHLLSVSTISFLNLLAFCTLLISLVLVPVQLGSLVTFSKSPHCFASCVHLLFPISYLSF